MIAKIYPDGHADLQGKKDPTHPVRYFDIRKLTPTECYRLMGVPTEFINRLMATEKRPYTAFVGVDKQLEVFGLEPSATLKEVTDAYEDAVRQLTEPQTPDDEDDTEEPVPAEPVDEETSALMLANYRQAYDAISKAQTEQRFGDVQIISNSSHYKLAGNSIVCDVLMYIYEEFLYPTGRRLNGELPDMFAHSSDVPQ